MGVALPTAAPASLFNASSFSQNASIPNNGSSTTPGTFGTENVISFNVPANTFVGAAAPTEVAVSMTLDHPVAGDLKAVLKAPNGAQVTLFSRTGALSEGSVGSTADASGTYTFTDRAPSAPTWWQAAANPDRDGDVVDGRYRASAAGSNVTGNSPNVSMMSTFQNVQANGTWELRISDGLSDPDTDDAGVITAASLELAGPRTATSSSLGGIPDFIPSDPDGAVLDVAFDISGMPDGPPTSVRLAFTGTHTYAGDLDVKLLPPAGSPATIFSRVGATSSGALGDDSNFDGTYTFFDGASGNLWTAADNAVGTSAVIPTASYRSSAALTGSVTSLVSQLSGVTDANGLWVMRFQDKTANDFGSVTGAYLELATAADTVAPATPTLNSLASPGISTTPRLQGTAEARSTIRIYTNGSCSGFPAFSGPATNSANAFANAGIPASVNPNSTTTFSVSAYDRSGNVSGCSSPRTYVSDTIRPSFPANLATTPASPANNNSPKLRGTVDDSSATVNIYRSDSCTGGAPVAFQGSVTDFNGAGITLENLADDQAHTFAADAIDPAGNRSPCSDAITYVEDSTSTTPTIAATVPASPSNSNQLKLRGSGAENGGTVVVFADSACAGATLVSGTAATFNGTGIDVSVPDNSVTELRVRAVDPAGNVSGCSNAATYTEDSIAPGVSLTGTNPASGSNDNAPRIQGTAEVGSMVRLFAGDDCGGASVATGSASDLAGGGLPVAVADNTTTAFRAIATDQAGNASTCSAPVTYAEVTPADVIPGPEPVIPGPGPGFDPPDDAACDEAKAKLAKAKEKLKKAKETGKKARIKKAKAKVRRAKQQVREACG